MKTKTLLVLFFFTSLLACKKNASGQVQHIPEETVYLEYERGKHPRLDGIINDSISCSMIWDTGIPEDVLVVSDSLIGLYGDSAWVQIGNFRKKLKVVYHNSDDFEILGFTTAFIGKDFF